jgi:demethylmenaquinone methyltransferase/2-methoxy-6-polyprenyl-1,4-benzoquinol methylase
LDTTGRSQLRQSLCDPRGVLTERGGREGRSSRFAQGLFTPLPDRYELLAEVLSFGQNGRWRREMVGHALADDPSSVLDVATGPGGVALEMTRRSSARIVGLDVTESMLAAAARVVGREGVSERVALVRATAEHLPFPDASFDALTFTYLLRYVPDPAAVLVELARVVRPGGAIASLEFAVPPANRWRAAWWCYTRMVLPVAGALTGGREWYEVGRFLGPSITRHYERYPLEWTIAAWRAAGIGDVEYRRMSLGGGLVMWGRRAGG